MNTNVVQSGIIPALPPHDKLVLEKASELSVLLLHGVHLTLQRLKEAEAEATARLQAYVPQDRYLTLKEAAAYIHFTHRTLDAWTRGKNSPVQFAIVGGEKRFRVSWLDQFIEKNSVKPREVSL